MSSTARARVAPMPESVYAGQGAIRTRLAVGGAISRVLPLSTAIDSAARVLPARQGRHTPGGRGGRKCQRGTSTLPARKRVYPCRHRLQGETGETCPHCLHPRPPDRGDLPLGEGREGVHRRRGYTCIHPGRPGRDSPPGTPQPATGGRGSRGERVLPDTPFSSVWGWVEGYLPCSIAAGRERRRSGYTR